ncbi:hypothetical protein OG921_04375 [Aldersonia sp. NBC_00410]|uniref:hypothetical protein n=1 Tax=Aldersonia sp. NBC_00410 TaxID=2975954 RepID=UPI00225654C5|nr:hypothetical protein [Aldersonia sp. NBC_00410]MCX5042416.1 hypothetical protein [Aldersonia sp. NBC_00410]
MRSRTIGYASLIAAALAVGGNATATASPSITPSGEQIVLAAPAGETWTCLLGTVGPTPYSGLRDEVIVGGAQPIWTLWFAGQDVHIACVSASSPYFVYQNVRVPTPRFVLPR